MINILLTFPAWWKYALNLIEASMNWFDDQETERTAAPQRFFYVRYLWQPFYGRVVWEVRKRLLVLCSSSSTCATCPPCIRMGWFRQTTKGA